MRVTERSAEWQTLQCSCLGMLVLDVTALACSLQGFVGMSQGSKQRQSVMPAPNHIPILQIQCAPCSSSTSLRACTLKITTWKTNLKYSNGIGVREAVQDHRSLHPIEIHPLDPVHVGFSPVDPVVIHGNAVWPPHALRDDAPGQRPVHVTPVDASPGVPPVCPEHQPGSRQRGYSKSTQQLIKRIQVRRGRGWNASHSASLAPHAFEQGALQF